MSEEAAEPIRVGPVRTPVSGGVGRGSVNYSGVLRVVLPVGAVGLVGALFFGGALFNEDGPRVDREWATAADVQGSIGRGAYAMGATPDGYLFSVTAAEARPDGMNATRLELTDFSGEITLGDGRSVMIAAPEGLYLRAEQTARLAGGVVVSTSDGYHVETDRVDADTGVRRLESDGRVVGHGPAGRLCAGAMALSDAEGGVARFDGGVVVVLTDLPGADAAAPTPPLPPLDEDATECQRLVRAIAP